MEAVGFQGEYSSDDLQEWLNETAEGFGQEWESNWMETWQIICNSRIEMAQVGNEEWAL